MRVLSGSSLIISVISWVLLGLAGYAQARVFDFSHLTIESVRIPPELIDDLFPLVTPGPTPTPAPTPDLPEPEGYQLDANDYLAVVTASGLMLNVDGLALESFPGYSLLRFDLHPKGDAAPMALYLYLWVKPDGKYDLRLADFDPQEYSLTLKIKGGVGEKSYELKPQSRILFSAQYLEAILFAGEGTPAAGTHPSHYIAMQEDERTILAGKDGKILLESRPVPGMEIPPSNPPPPPSGGNTGNETTVPPPSNPNPSTNFPTGGSLDSDSGIPPGFNGQIGGGGALSCALNGAGAGVSSFVMLLLLGLPLAVIGFKRRF